MARFVAIAFGLVALVIASVSCAPATEPSPTPEPRVDDYAPYYDLSVDDGRTMRVEGGWEYRTRELRLRVAVGSRAPLLSSRGDYGPSRISFTLHNESPDPVKVVWDESSMVLPDGSTSRVAHRGVGAAEVHRVSPPTVVPPSAHLDEFVVPTVNVSESGGWTVAPFVREDARAGTTFRLYLTLEVDGERTPVDLVFTRNERAIPLSE